MDRQEVHGVYQGLAAMAQQLSAMDLQLQHLMELCAKHLQREAPEDCPHPDTRRSVIATMGSTDARWMCRDCGEEFEGTPTGLAEPEKPA